MLRTMFRFRPDKLITPLLAILYLDENMKLIQYSYNEEPDFIPVNFHGNFIRVPTWAEAIGRVDLEDMDFYGSFLRLKF